MANNIIMKYIFFEYVTFKRYEGEITSLVTVDADFEIMLVPENNEKQILEEIL